MNAADTGFGVQVIGGGAFGVIEEDNWVAA